MVETIWTHTKLSTKTEAQSQGGDGQHDARQDRNPALYVSSRPSKNCGGDGQDREEPEPGRPCACKCFLLERADLDQNKNDKKAESSEMNKGQKEGR